MIIALTLTSLGLAILAGYFILNNTQLKEQLDVTKTKLKLTTDYVEQIAIELSELKKSVKNKPSRKSQKKTIICLASRS